ncbi:hypothetical protein [Cellulomonas sp. Root137]|uniref:hypothetical protein n=1 Tax=Cellulomonas sp. Root137 TaxID=1736459 RepID=UPI0006F4C08D|nr:hypothetical protein [Cellulomonas sp. Root137]KQY47702.1 hypothetical protein ASD18_10505 [Cellulomonas sp. Root137]KRD44825.1 hypothetical protein ASE38_12330 [Cellulomonas sp. Root930]
MGNDEATWRIDVTDGDIRAAKRAWQDASERGTDNDEIASRYATYRQLVVGQAQQIADDFRARRVG